MIGLAFGTTVLVAPQVSAASSTSVMAPAGTRAATSVEVSWTEGPCSTIDGVTVVIDFRELGGGVHVRCAPGPVRSGLDALSRAGIGYQTSIRSPGFVCRIAGRPANDPCVDTSPASAYWSYWVAPRGGNWCFSNWGAGFRTPPPGSVEGWSFSMGRTATTSPPPGIAPPVAIPGTSTGSLDAGHCAAGGSTSQNTTTTSTTPRASTTTRPPRISTVPPSPSDPRGRESSTGVDSGGTSSGRDTTGDSGADGRSGAVVTAQPNRRESPVRSDTPDDPSGVPDGEDPEGTVDGSGGPVVDADSHDDPAGGTNGADPDGSAGQKTNGDDSQESAAGDPDTVGIAAPVDLGGGRRSGGSVTGVVMAAALVGVMGAVTWYLRRSDGSRSDA